MCPFGLSDCRVKPRRLRAPHASGPHHDTHQIQKWIGPNWIGQNWPGQNQDGQTWTGQIWSNQDGQNGIGQSQSLLLERPSAGPPLCWTAPPLDCSSAGLPKISRPGLHMTAREPKRAHLKALAFKNTTKIQREDPQEREERMKIVAGGAKFLASHPLGPPPCGALTLRGPHFFCVL